MDESTASISPSDLYSRLGIASAPVLIDVRRQQAYDADPVLIIGAVRRVPEQVGQWLSALPGGREIVAYCVHGHEVSQGVVKALRDAGRSASFLQGGISAWRDKGFPTRRVRKDADDGKWVTREHPKIDRIACPWLVSRFIDPLAEFIYVPPADVLSAAKRVGGLAYDIKGVEFGHHGERCSFDAIVAYYGIQDRALERLATIVRGADTSRPDLTPQGEGLLAISCGLSANFPDDHDMLSHGLVMYDALYTWCRLEAARQQSQSRGQPS